MHHSRIRLHLHSLTLPKYSNKPDSWEIMCYQLLGGCLIFIGSHGQFITFMLQCFQQFRNSRIRATLVGIMPVIMQKKFFTNAEHILLGFLSFGQCTLKQFVDAVTHHKVIGSDFMSRISQSLQSMIRTMCQIGNGIQ